MNNSTGPDPILNSDRLAGSTAPERGSEGSNVAGRPATERSHTGFHEEDETVAEESESLNEGEARLEGGSYDGVAPLQNVENE